MKCNFLLLFYFAIGSLFGTAQFPDYLIDHGDTIAIFSNPLEGYFELEGSREISGFKTCGSTACWRGYVAYWELRHDSLFLTGIEACHLSCDSAVHSDLGAMFGAQYSNGAVFADWVSFEVIHPFGEQIKYIHQGYDSIFEYERGYCFEEGLLAGLSLYDNRKSRQSIYTIKPDTLYAHILQTIDWTLVEQPEKKDKTRVIIGFKVNDNGHLIDVRILRGLNPILDNEAKRVIESIPYWDVYFRRGKAIAMSWVLPISFDRGHYERRLSGEGGK